MPKAYEHADIEKKWYPIWESKGFFAAEDTSDKTPFAIAIPPPNVTGSLHMGHALTVTIEDIIVRFKRMQGHNTLWMPGTDHAGIATQMVVERKLAEDGISRFDLGREGFLEKVWEWKDQYHARITEQLKAMGVSVDWERERFTMDEGLSRAVRKVFVELYNDGLMYRAKRLVNWSPGIQTVLSDLEVEHEEENGHLWHLAYPVTGSSDERLVVATTRPETMVGDTAVAVHPDDERYQHLIGKTIDLPLTDRKIPIIADGILVDMEFGTGAVKVTPAHDFNDFETGKRHDLPMITVLDGEAKMNENAPEKYRGMDRFVARKAMVADLEALGLLVGIDDHKHSVGRCQRSGAVVEPMLSDQWYVKTKPLAEPAIEAVRSGKTKFLSKEWEKVYFHWMENIQDWCVSRQLWWGHRIPAWFCGSCGECTVAMEDPTACSHCGSDELRQDEDVLDTWFSSGLWPFSTLGWPDETEALKTFYPTDVMETGFDIIFFWVARMMMMGLRFMGDVPFRTVYLHAMVRDEHGQKMSKTRGNVIDPLVVTAEHGADALRFTLATQASQGHDIKLSVDRVAGYRAFANKIWNATRFLLMNIPEGHTPAALDVDKAHDLGLADRWILAKLDEAVTSVGNSLDAYELNEAAKTCYEFFWKVFCDWYIEFAKPALRSEDGRTAEATREVLMHVLDNALRLLHPFMPYITEEIWTRLPLANRDGETLLRAAWPTPDARRVDTATVALVDQMIDVIAAVRTIRGENRIPPKTRLKVFVNAPDEATAALVRDAAEYLDHLANVEELEVGVGLSRPPKSATAVAGAVTVYLPLEGLVDIDAEVARIRKKMGKIDKDIGKFEKKLSNPRFLDNAPAEVVAADRAKLAGLKDERATYEGTLEALTA